jgi:branched-chain amino acid transport system substrate-binding protein
MTTFTWRRSGLLAAGLLAVASLALSGCASDSGESGSGSDGPIKIAASMPLTGDSAAYGVGTENGIDLAIDEINKAGGIGGRKLELTKFDDKCDPAAAATAANDIISNSSFVAVIGNVCSSAMLAQLPIFKRVNLPILAASTSSPQLAAAHDPNFSRIVPSDSVQGAATIKLAIKVLGLKRVAILYPSDDYGQSLNQVATDAIKAYGGKLTTAQTYVTGSTNDFSAQLSNIAASNPDALFLAGYYADMGTAVNQSVRAFNGKKISLVANAQDQQPDFVKLAGDAGNGTYFTNVYDPGNTSAANQKFVKAYKARYGKVPGIQEDMGYDNVYVLKAALEKTKGSEKGLAAAIRATTYDGAVGTISFDENGDNVGGSMVALRLEDGEFTFSADLTKKLNAK